MYVTHTHEITRFYNSLFFYLHENEKFDKIGIIESTNNYLEVIKLKPTSYVKELVHSIYCVHFKSPIPITLHYDTSKSKCINSTSQDNPPHNLFS